MDRQTKQWIIDRVIWILGLALAVLVTVPAIAGERDGSPGAADSSSAQCHRAVLGHRGIEV